MCIAKILGNKTGCPQIELLQYLCSNFVQETQGVNEIYGLTKEDTNITENKGSKGATISINFPDCLTRVSMLFRVGEKSLLAIYLMVGGFKIRPQF